MKLKEKNFSTETEKKVRHHQQMVDLGIYKQNTQSFEFLWKWCWASYVFFVLHPLMLQWLLFETRNCCADDGMSLEVLTFVCNFFFRIFLTELKEVLWVEKLLILSLFQECPIHGMVNVPIFTGSHSCVKNCMSAVPHISRFSHIIRDFYVIWQKLM